jgi:hypothetical protein
MNEENTTQHDEDDPLGELRPPGRIKHGARVFALAGVAIGLGVAGAVGGASDITVISPPLN